MAFPYSFHPCWWPWQSIDAAALWYSISHPLVYFGSKSLPHSPSTCLAGFLAIDSWPAALHSSTPACSSPVHTSRTTTLVTPFLRQSSTMPVGTPPSDSHSWGTLLTTPHTFYLALCLLLLWLIVYEVLAFALQTTTSALCICHYPWRASS